MKTVTEWCPACDKDVKVVVKVFNTHICTECGKILSSRHSMSKVGR